MESKRKELLLTLLFLFVPAKPPAAPPIGIDCPPHPNSSWTNGPPIRALMPLALNGFHPIQHFFDAQWAARLPNLGFFF